MTPRWRALVRVTNVSSRGGGRVGLPRMLVGAVDVVREHLDLAVVFAVSAAIPSGIFIAMLALSAAIPRGLAIAMRHVW